MALYSLFLHLCCNSGRSPAEWLPHYVLAYSHRRATPDIRFVAVLLGQILTPHKFYQLRRLLCLVARLTIAHQHLRLLCIPTIALPIPSSASSWHLIVHPTVHHKRLKHVGCPVVREPELRGHVHVTSPSFR